MWPEVAKPVSRYSAAEMAAASDPSPEQSPPALTRRQPQRADAGWSERPYHYYRRSPATVPFFPQLRMNDLLTYTKSELASSIDLIEKLVGLESPSTEKAAVDRCGRFLAEHLRGLDGQIEIVPNEERGDHLISRFAGSGKACSAARTLRHRLAARHTAADAAPSRGIPAPRARCLRHESGDRARRPRAARVAGDVHAEPSRRDVVHHRRGDRQRHVPRARRSAKRAGRRRSWCSSPHFRVAH